MAILAMIFKIVTCVLITDFLSGFFHWLEDCYGEEDWPIIGDQIVKPNILHHRNGRYFVQHSWLYSARVLICLGALILLVAHLAGFLNWMTVLVVTIGVNANEIHKWTHRTPSENGPIISALQRWRILQSPAHHYVHHRGAKNTHYCVVTDHLNRLLDALHFWPLLEAIVHAVFRVRPRTDDAETAQ